MNIDISGQHLDITPALRSYVQNKFERLERHFDQVTNVHVVLTVVSKLEHHHTGSTNDGAPRRRAVSISSPRVYKSIY
jgi:ribosomal subunit interface protein